MAPNPNRDSVDADDGLIDGSGSSGHGYAQQTSLASVSFTFSEAVLGSLPTHVGVVWTDGGTSTGAPTQFTFEFFDGLGASIGSITETLGDGMITGQTAEDRFFGAIHGGGISPKNLSSDWTGDGPPVGRSAKKSRCGRGGRCYPGGHSRGDNQRP